MTKEDIIKLAREAGMGGMLTDIVCTWKELERFAELVAAPLKAENEALKTDAKRLDWLNLASETWYSRKDHGSPFKKHKTIREAIDAARAKEQE